MPRSRGGSGRRTDALETGASSENYARAMGGSLATGHTTGHSGQHLRSTARGTGLLDASERHDAVTHTNG